MNLHPSTSTFTRRVAHQRKLLHSPATGMNILSCDLLGPTFQQKKIQLKSVHKQKS